MTTLPAPGEQGPQFQFTALTGSDRIEIVQLAGDLNIVGAAYVTASQFDLTALGADVDLDGVWNVFGFGLNEWKHVATGGRDQYVRIVLKGYLFPFGHRAVVVQVAERIFLSDPANPADWSDAVVQLSTFIKVIQPVLTYPAPGQPFDANSWPFTKITMKTLITPPLVGLPDLQGIIPKPNSSHCGQAVLITTAANAEVTWIALAEDRAGTEIHMETPLVFMFGDDNTVPYQNEFDPSAGGVSAQVAAAYNTLDSSHRTAVTNGAPIRYAPPVVPPPGASSPQGATTHPTTSLIMLAAPATGDPTAPGAPWSGALTEAQLFADLQPAFYPAVGSARVRLPAADGLSRGTFSDSTAPATGGISIQYYAAWVSGYQATGATPWSGNPGTVYMELTDYANDPANGPTLQFPGDAVGGIGRPNVNVSGLSAQAGLVSGPLDVYAQMGKQDPSAYFPGLTGPSAPQLLGGLHLGDILGAFLDSNGLPSIVNDLDPTTGIRTITYTMTAQTSDWPSTNPVFQTLGPNPADPQPDVDGTMALTAVFEVTPSGTSTYKVTGSITPFLVNILGQGSALDFLLIPINKCVFTSKSGSKPDIHVEVGQVQFQGALQFVNALEQFLEALGGSGFQVSVLPTQIKAGFSIGLPDIGIGVVDISNLGMSASIEIPFLGAPALATFSFATKEKPFLVTVSMFGGGGYITLVLGLQSVQQISASIEFAGNFSLDLYVASGGITLTAGIYYNYTNGVGVTLTGFVKLVGELEVLGIISITVELDLSLTYFEDSTTGASYVSGTATLSASIHIVFFTITIPITIHKQFTGSSNNTANPQIAHMLAATKGPQAELSNIVGSPPPPLVNPVSFSDLIDAPTWATYCAAFAA